MWLILALVLTFGGALFFVLYRRGYVLATPLPADNRPVLVTGASRGFGFDIAAHLNEVGFRVFATVRKEADGDALVAAAARPDAMHVVVMDVTKADQVAAAVEEVEAQLGADQGFWGLVNNAGVEVMKLIGDMDDSDTEYQFGVNLFGTIRVTRHFLPLLLRGGRGPNELPRIVNVGSLFGVLPDFPTATGYATSKAAIEALTRSQRAELYLKSKKPVWVTLLRPGAFATDMLKDIDGKLGVEDRHPVYGPGQDLMSKFVNGQAAGDVYAIGVKVAHIMRAPRVSHAYAVGPWTTAMSWLACAPQEIVDVVVGDATLWPVFKHAYRLLHSLGVMGITTPPEVIARRPPSK